MKSVQSVAIALAVLSLPTIAQAQIAGTLAAPLNTLGATVSGVAAAHAGIAPLVDSISPTVEPATDGVTNAVAAVGTGVSGTGSQVQANGVRIGTHSDGSPIVSIAKTTGDQGSLLSVAGGRR